MKKIFIILCIAISLLFFVSNCKGESLTDGWDFYFFGVNTKIFKEDVNYLKVGAGVVTSVAVHSAGHIIYGKINNMNFTFNGFQESIPSGYSDKQYREFSQAGFLAQNLGGLLLTSIPYTRQSDFTKGYVGTAFIMTVTYPLVWQHNDGDLYYSNIHGGNATWEYVGYTALATHNLFKIKWYKE
jgi:hypothetical protein